MRGRGWRVFATVRRQNDVVTLSKLGRGLIEPLMMDVTDQVSIERAMQTIEERAGRLDALVNNAGILMFRGFEDYSEDEINKLINVNLMGVIHGCQAAIPAIERAGGGASVNMSAADGIGIATFRQFCV